MGKPSYQLTQRLTLMKFLDTAARLTAIVAQGANLSLATALDPPSTSAGTYDDSTDTSFVAAGLIFEAERSKKFQCNGWLASSYFI